MENDYEIKLDYENEPDISQVFETLHEFTTALSNYNSMLVQCISNEIITTTSLVAIEKGSIKTKVQDLIKKIPDEAKIELYVDKPKEAIKDMLKSGRKILFKLADLDVSQKEKEELLFKNTKDLLDNSELSSYGVKVKKDILLSHANDVYKPIKRTKNKISINIDDTKYELKDCFDYDIEKTFKETTRENRFRANLKIKKPVLIGNSKWEFVYGKSIDAEILDIHWLEKLRNRGVGLLSGDMLDCEVKSVIIYNDDNEIIESHYFILKVYNIISPDNEQISF